MAMLEVRDLRKSFYTYAKPGLQAGIFHKPGARKVVSQLDVLKGVDLTVNKGDVVAILGPSGSGKTTFLRCLNFLEATDSGTLIFDGEQFDLGKITKADIARLRKKTAFVFQNYNLFRNKTALQNVTEGLVIARKMPKAQADAIRMINEANPNHNFLALRSMEAMEKVADGKATKLIVPSDMQNLAATVAAIKEAAADK